MKSSDRREERAQAEGTLATVDRALASGSPSADDDRERELGQLALALGAGAPEPRADFAAGLEARVADGFDERRPDDSAQTPRPITRPRRSKRRRPRLIRRLPRVRSPPRRSRSSSRPGC